jgi:hypothetical protein
MNEPRCCRPDLSQPNGIGQHLLRQRGCDSCCTRCQAAVALWPRGSGDLAQGVRQLAGEVQSRASRGLPLAVERRAGRNAGVGSGQLSRLIDGFGTCRQSGRSLRVAFLLFLLPCRLPKRNSVRQMALTSPFTLCRSCTRSKAEIGPSSCVSAQFGHGHMRPTARMAIMGWARPRGSRPRARRPARTVSAAQRQPD